MVSKRHLAVPRILIGYSYASTLAGKITYSMSTAKVPLINLIFFLFFPVRLSSFQEHLFLSSNQGVVAILYSTSRNLTQGKEAPPLQIVRFVNNTEYLSFRHAAPVTRTRNNALNIYSLIKMELYLFHRLFSETPCRFRIFFYLTSELSAYAPKRCLFFLIIKIDALHFLIIIEHNTKSM